MAVFDLLTFQTLNGIMGDLRHGLPVNFQLPTLFCSQLRARHSIETYRRQPSMYNAVGVGA